MFRMLCAFSLIALIVPFVGCGGDNEALVQAQIDDMNALADAIEKGASEDEIKKIETRMEENEKKLEALELTKEEKDALMEKYEDEINKATERMIKAMMSQVEAEFANLDFEDLSEYEDFETADNWDNESGE